ncbi:hypothetical protein Tco_0771129 [Tanacetum coccineum]|uniref:Xylulose kinase-1 n=1 Tax=Tanacetum coccineum TaxID=301880 RepID=A0ABQ4ZI87_9ASTR
MATLKFADIYNMVLFLLKPTKSDGFDQIVDFLKAQPIKYALTMNPTIYISCIEQFWTTEKVKTINEETQIHAKVDGKKVVITESIVRRDLQLEDEAGEGSALPTDPQHTPTIIPSSSQPEKTQKPRKPKRKATKVPQPSGPTKVITNEAVYKELDDRLVRAATTASSLEAEQVSGNITKTQYKATPNESSSLGTSLGGGPRGNTLRSDEDIMKLKELMELCTNLQQRVLELEKTKTTQAVEISSLKKRVKKLEKKDKPSTTKMKRLYKSVESFVEKEDLGEDASKQGKIIDDIDVDADITLVSDQHVDEEVHDADKDMCHTPKRGLDRITCPGA